jgi:pseudouridine synthase
LPIGRVSSLKLRLQKVLADAGVASRRAGERLIAAGRVAINGAVVTRLGTTVDPEGEEITVDGVPVKARRKLYVALNKPRGYLCTRHDPESRQIVHELLPPEWRNLYAVGRLDRDSEGLLFLTNDGDFCLRMTHPRYGMRKRYRVTVDGYADAGLSDRLEHGVEQGGERLKVERARVLSANHTHSQLDLELAEGKNREIRRLLEALGLKVSRLQRVQIGPIKLGELRLGRWRTLTGAEINSLLSPST